MLRDSDTIGFTRANKNVRTTQRELAARYQTDRNANTDAKTQYIKDILSDKVRAEGTL